MLRNSLGLALFSVVLVVDIASAAPPGTEINNYHPLYLFETHGSENPDASTRAADIVASWNTLPDAIKPYSVLNISINNQNVTVWQQHYHDMLPALQEAGVPVSITLSKDIPGGFYPLLDLRALLETYTVIRGVHAEGLSFTAFPPQGTLDPANTPREVSWLKAVIELAGQSGRFVTIQLSDLDWPRMMSNIACRELYDAFHNYRDNVIALTDPHGPYYLTQSAAVMGLWLEGAIQNWGTTAGSAWYREAHFREPGVFGPPQDTTSMPAAMYKASILGGAMTGATVYRFEEPRDLWGGSNGVTYWGEILEPALSELVDDSLIARIDQVQQKIKVAYRLNPAATVEEFSVSRVDIDPVFSRGLIDKGVYGMELPGQIPEIIPNTGRYYRIPILSPYASDETLRLFQEVLLPGALVDAQSWRSRLDPYYAPDGTGSAFISRMGRQYFVMHTRENLYEEQTYVLPAAPAPLSDITLTRQGNSVKISWPFRESDVSYSVFRVLNPLTNPPHVSEFQLVANNLDERSYLDESVSPADTLVYAVSATTNEKSTLEGTVNYGDYITISTVKSPIVGGSILRPYTVQGISTPVSTEKRQDLPKEQYWWDDLSSGAGNTVSIGRSISSQLLALADAFSREDLDAIINIYAPNYADSEGMGRAYVGKVFQAFLDRHRAGQMHRQIRAWDFSDMQLSGEIHVTLYCMFTGLPDTSDRYHDTDRSVWFPKTPDQEIRFTFIPSNFNEWKILRTDPPLPRLEDVLP